MLRAAKRGMMILNISYLQKHFLEKHLKEKCLSEAKQQLSLKLFLNFCFIQKSFSNIWEKQTILSRESLSANGLKAVVFLTAYSASLHHYELATQDLASTWQQKKVKINKTLKLQRVIALTCNCSSQDGPHACEQHHNKQCTHTVRVRLGS